ncbi:helix-turn-helix transcriptional regulator [uncultured Lacinutrix sp.]|uniref:helix-turn-helix domain-containing protein n=1 Tax=uncultured Lacinutrix sp. TaxID=574032 RepID=UPI00261A39B4|nr:helix-turn-helix transcriptional regulator [uncultured Lacinutrix sp.]
MSVTQQILSANLKAIRKEKKIYQKDIETRTGLLASTYSRIENMEVVPNLASIEKIAEALEVSVVELFQSREITDKSIAQKLEMVDKLSEYNRNVFEVMTDTIIEKDKLEKLQEVKKKNRLAELDKARKKSS